MNGFAIFCILCVVLCIYALISYEISTYMRIAAEKANPSSMEDRANFHEFSFVHDGFKYHGGRSSPIVSHSKKTEHRVGDWPTHKTIKNSVMLDDATNMPFFVMLIEETYRNNTATKIHDWRPIYNRVDMIDFVGMIDSEQVSMIDLDGFTYLDDVRKDTTVMAASHGISEKVAA